MSTSNLATLQRPGVAFADPDEAAATARRAADAMAAMTQEQTDRICESMAAAAWRDAPRLAALAVEETGYGRAADKVLKDRYCSWGVWQRIKDEPSAGIVHRTPLSVEMADPVGVVMAICPVTNPTSTPIFKALSAAKGRNATVIAPHPRAVRCGVAVAEVLSEAALAAGGPEQLVTCLAPASIEQATKLMGNHLVRLILATGGSGMVRAAYRSGKPAFGVGPGNVPVYVDGSCPDPAAAVAGMLRSKLMDYGTSCSAEQCLIVHQRVAGPYRAALERSGGRFLDPTEKVRLQDVCVDDQGAVRPEAVGQSAASLAERAGIDVESNTELLIVEIERVGPEEPFSKEILTSVIAYHEVPDENAGFAFCDAILHRGGLGHTAVVWAADQVVIERFGELPAGRVLVNLPGTWGTSGMLTTLDPSFSIGTGPWGGSINSDNITFRQTIQRRRLLREARTPEELMTELERGPTEISSESTEHVDRPLVPVHRRPASPTVSGPGGATAGLNSASASYAAVPLSPEEEEIVEASVTEILRRIGTLRGEGAR